ncbi:MAG: hypothetical protein ACK6EB_26380, partial [Planctomyces sp.]
CDGAGEVVGCREWGENRREVPKRDGLGVPARTRASERRWEPAAGLLFPVGSGRASRGRESAGEAAVALHCRAGLGQWLCVEVFCPLTPDPSPPFHGGVGGIAGEPRTVVRG